MSFGPHSFSDLDFADDVALLAELLELLVPQGTPVPLLFATIHNVTDRQTDGQTQHCSISATVSTVGRQDVAIIQ